MHELLAGIDPVEAARIHPRNRHRIIRALEIFHLTGQTKTELITGGSYKISRYNYEQYCLAPGRERLYEVINSRVDQMIADGWLTETETLAADGLGEAIRKANVLGYNELLDHMEGRISLEQAVEMIKMNHRRYAKRQMTWFRGQKSIRFFEDGEELLEELRKSG
jgi:tRNA dimethylallyltransferase